MPKTPSKISKKKKYNARFPPARIKKIMQTDEEVGKVAAAVPVIISRALEMFIESLITETAKTTISKNAKTLSTSHIKQTISSEKQFDFLRDLVANVPDHQVEDNNGDAAVDHEIAAKKSRGRPKKSKDQVAIGRHSRPGASKACDDSEDEDDEDDEDTETDDESRSHALPLTSNPSTSGASVPGCFHERLVPPPAAMNNNVAGATHSVTGNAESLRLGMPQTCSVFNTAQQSQQFGHHHHHQHHHQHQQPIPPSKATSVPSVPAFPKSAYPPYLPQHMGYSDHLQQPVISGSSMYSPSSDVLQEQRQSISLAHPSQGLAARTPQAEDDDCST